MNNLMGYGGAIYQVNNPTLASMIVKRRYSMPQQQSAPAQQAAQTTTIPFQSYLNGLNTDASNALNGGLLGYMPSRFISPGSNPQEVAAPQGSFRFPFGMLRGY